MQAQQFFVLLLVLFSYGKQITEKKSTLTQKKEKIQNKQIHTLVIIFFFFTI